MRWVVSDADLLIRQYERKAQYVGKYKLFDTIYGNNVFIDELMYFIIKYFIKDRYHSLVDPTCGVANRQFSKIIPILRHWDIDYRPCDKNPGNWACKNGYSNCVCDVFRPETLPRGEAWIYDPPYLPSRRNDKTRATDYSMDRDHSIDEIKRYYSDDVFNAFIRNGAKLIIVKGADFYYPPDSDNLVLFTDLIPRNKHLKLVAVVKYRFFYGNIALMNYRIRNLGDMRTQIVTTQYAVFKVL